MNINVDNTKKFNIDSNTLFILYRHYKDYLLPLVVIISCIALVFLIVIPQIQQYFVSQDQLKAEQEKLNVLKNNYNYLSSLDDTKLDADLKSLSQALPPNKDFAGIMNAIAVVSAKTGVAVGDFEFSVGDLAKSNDEISAYPSIKIEVNLGGNAQAITRFSTELLKTVPLSEVTSIKTSGNLSVLLILFYYKSFPPQNISSETPIVPINEKNLSLINEIASWNISSGDLILPLTPLIPSSSSESSAFDSSGPLGNNPSPF